MSFATVQKTIELIFSLFLFCENVVYPNANYRKKLHGVVLVYVLLSRSLPFCVFNVIVNLFIMRTLLSYSRYLITVLYFRRKGTFFTLIVHFTVVNYCLLRSK